MLHPTHWSESQKEVETPFPPPNSRESASNNIFDSATSPLHQARLLHVAIAYCSIESAAINTLKFKERTLCCFGVGYRFNVEPW